MNKKISPICSQCGSPLIFVSEEVIKPEGSRFSQVNTIYRCSNEDCQAEKDKQTAKRLQLREEKAKIDQERAEKKKKVLEEH
ncbi:MAG TPA: hypothetical protein VE090_01515 [Methylomirabilota bacterium]|nr:hypothetical protein [Methylomirabilota bacterium]